MGGAGIRACGCVALLSVAQPTLQALLCCLLGGLGPSSHRCFSAPQDKIAEEGRRWECPVVRQHRRGLLFLWGAHPLPDPGEGPCGHPGPVQGAADQERQLQVRGRGGVRSGDSAVCSRLAESLPPPVWPRAVGVSPATDGVWVVSGGRGLQAEQGVWRVCWSPCWCDLSRPHLSLLTILRRSALGCPAGLRPAPAGSSSGSVGRVGPMGSRLGSAHGGPAWVVCCGHWRGPGPSAGALAQWRGQKPHAHPLLPHST